MAQKPNREEAAQLAAQVEVLRRAARRALSRDADNRGLYSEPVTEDTSQAALDILNTELDQMAARLVRGADRTRILQLKKTR